MLNRNKYYLCHAHADDKNPVFALCRCHVWLFFSSSLREADSSELHSRSSRLNGAEIDYIRQMRHSPFKILPLTELFRTVVGNCIQLKQCMVECQR